MSKRSNNDFTFDAGMVGIMIMMIVFWPAGLLLLIRRMRSSARGRDEQRRLRNMGITTIITSLFFMYARQFGWGLLTMLAGAGIAGYGYFSKKQAERFKRYLAIIGGRSPMAIQEIAARSNVEIDTVRRDLKKMIDKGFFGLDTYIDPVRDCIVLDGIDSTTFQGARRAGKQESDLRGVIDKLAREVANEFGDAVRGVRENLAETLAGKQAGSPQAPAQKTAESAPTATKEPVRETAKAKTASQPVKDEPKPAQQDDQFGHYITEIRDVNNRIADAEISAKIDQIEAVTTKIFSVVRKKPERIGEIRKFMNYYLPTTLKLLDTYALLEEQGIEGKNITASKEQISGILDTLVAGFEKQLDMLFSSQALDVSTDIEVMESMLSADGLKESDFKLKRQTGAR